MTGDDYIDMQNNKHRIAAEADVMKEVGLSLSTLTKPQRERVVAWLIDGFDLFSDVEGT